MPWTTPAPRAIYAVRQEGTAPASMEALNPRRMRVTVAPRKYPDELRERAIRMALEARRDPGTRIGAFRRIGERRPGGAVYVKRMVA